MSTRQRSASLYRLDPDHSVTRVISSVTISNGIAFSADDETMFYIDSPTRSIDAFDFDLAAGALTRRRQLVAIQDRDVEPDGMTIDADGCLWVALWGGGAVRRYTPQGKLDRVVPLPVSQVTSCTFGGPNHELLFITSASVGLSPEQRREQPHAGGLFVLRPGVAGMPPFAFRG